MTQSTSMIIYNFVRTLLTREQFTSNQLYQMTKHMGTTHGGICGILHRLVREGMLTIVGKEGPHIRRACYIFSVLDPTVVIRVRNETRRHPPKTRRDTGRHALFKKGQSNKSDTMRNK